MKHIIPFIIKFIVSFIILSVFLTRFAEISLWGLILTTAVLAGFSYLVGDMLILPRTNNTIATTIDFGLSFFTIAFMVYVLTNLSSGILWSSAFAALGITLFEAFFHIYLMKRIFPDKRNMERRETRPLKYQTEFSKEIYPEPKDKKDN